MSTGSTGRRDGGPPLPIRLVGRAVGADLTCWAGIDPETLVISTMVSDPRNLARSNNPFESCSNARSL